MSRRGRRLSLRDDTHCASARLRRLTSFGRYAAGLGGERLWWWLEGCFFLTGLFVGGCLVVGGGGKAEQKAEQKAAEKGGGGKLKAK